MTQTLPSYTLKRAKRKSIALVILPCGGLEVRAPRWVTKRAVESFIEERAAWITKHQSKIATRPKATGRTWQTGDELHINGEPLTLKVYEGKQVSVTSDGESLHVYTRSPRPENVRKLVMSWYKEQAQAILQPRLQHWAAMMDEKEPSLSLTNPKSRWGSCQGKKRHICLALRLLTAPKDVQDYVIVHELSHLKHMDHSPKFWQRVAAFCPDYKNIENQMRHHQQLWQFDS